MAFLLFSGFPRVDFQANVDWVGLINLYNILVLVFIYLFVYLFICLFIYSFICLFLYNGNEPVYLLSLCSKNMFIPFSNTSLLQSGFLIGYILQNMYWLSFGAKLIMINNFRVSHIVRFVSQAFRWIK